MFFFDSYKEIEKTGNLSAKLSKKHTEGPMELMKKDRLKIEPVKRIAGVFPEGKVTLVLGLPGTGKTTSTLKAFIRDGIKPIWFNYDMSDTVIDTEKDVDMFDGEHVIDFLNGEIDDIKDRVVIIDTYERLWELVSAEDKLRKKTYRRTKEEMQHLIVNLLEKRCEMDGNTIVVIAHPTEYVGRDGIFNDNPTLARRAYELISLEVKLSTSIKDLKAGTAATRWTYIKKARCYSGKTSIQDWMRE